MRATNEKGTEVMLHDKNELWIRALVDDQGSVVFQIPADHEDVPTGWIPLAHSFTLAIAADADALLVRVRLRVLSSADGTCEPDWMPVSPDQRDRDVMGDTLSEPLEISRTETRSLHLQLETSIGPMALDLKLGIDAPGGIDIVLRAPPVEPPPSCRTTEEHRPTAVDGGVGSGRHVRATRHQDEPLRGPNHMQEGR